MRGPSTGKRPAPTTRGPSRRALSLAAGHHAKVRGYLDLARKEGGTILCGGEVVSPPGRCAGGWFLSPAVIEAVLDGRLRAGVDSTALLDIRAIHPSWEEQERRCMLRK